MHFAYVRIVGQFTDLAELGKIVDASWDLCVLRKSICVPQNFIGNKFIATYPFCDVMRGDLTSGPWTRGLIGVVSNSLSFEVDPYSSMVEFCRVLRELLSLQLPQ